MTQQRVLVTVKTYPTLSKKYGETVCTAGIRDDGTWVRIYPVPFRRLGASERYKLYDWVNCDLRPNSSDPRSESFRPTSEIVPVGHIGTANDWAERRRLLLNTASVFDRIEVLAQMAKRNEASLAVFKPTELLGFSWEEEDNRNWDPIRLDQMRQQHNQLGIFEDNVWRETFQVIPKLPYNFSYRFKDADGKTSRLQILEWQIGQLYWNCLDACEGDEQMALQKVKEKYWGQFRSSDLHFFLGTTQQFHFVAPNPWVIVGVFPAPHEVQPALF